MNVFHFRRRCPVVRDLLLARATEPEAAPELPSFAENHIIACRSCREFSEALPVIDRLGSAWQAPEPPPGLARATMERIAPHWPEAGRGVSRQETRLIWTTGLSLAGALAAVGLILADRLHPLLAGNAGLEDLVQVGLKVGVLQVLGGAVVSIALLVVRAIRSTDSDIRDRDDHHGAGRE